MASPTFIFNADESPAQLAERKRRAKALLAAGTSGVASNVGQGIAQLGQALAGRLGVSMAEGKEAKNMTAARRLLAGIGSPGRAKAPGMASVAPSAAPSGIEGRIANDLVSKLKVSPAVAAGIVGNLSHETGGFKHMQELNPVVPGSRGGTGWAQWTGPRRKQFEAYAAQNGMDPGSYDANLGFLTQELTSGPESKVMASLQGVDDPAQAAQVFSQQFLRPGIPHMESRVSRAQKIADMLKSGGISNGQPQIVPASAPPPQAPQMAPQPQVQPAAAQMPPPASQGPMSAYDRMLGNAVDRGTAPEAVSNMMQGAPRGPSMMQGGILGDIFGGNSEPAPAMDQGMVPGEAGGDRLAQLQEAMFSPWVAEVPGAVEFLQREYEREYQRVNPEPMDPLKQLQLEKGQLELDQMRNPKKEPIKVGDTLLDPETFKPLYEPTPKQDKPPAGIQEYEYYVQQERAAGREPVDFYTYEKSKAPTTNVNVGSGVKEEKVFDETKARADSARAAYTGLNSLREASAALPGAITGAAANERLALQKVASLFGVGDTQAIQDTETFRSAIAPQVAAMMKATVGSTQISNADREFAEKAAAGSITLDATSINRLLNIMKAANSEVVRGYNRDLNTIYPDNGNFQRERALFSVPNVPKSYASPIGPGQPAIQAPTNVQPGDASIDELIKKYGG